MSSSMSVSLVTAQQPTALEDRHEPLLRALQAQPEKRVTRAVSLAGADSKNYKLSEPLLILILTTTNK